ATPIFQAGTVTCSDSAPCSTAAFARNLRTPYVITWNFDLQRAITPNLSLDLAYLGNHGVKLYGVNDINAPAVGSGYSAGFLNACAADPTTCQFSKGLPFNTAASGDLAEVGPYSSKFPYLSYIYQ